MKESITSIISSLQTATNELESLKEQVDEPKIEEGQYWKCGYDYGTVIRINYVQGRDVEALTIDRDNEEVWFNKKHIIDKFRLLSDDEVDYALREEVKQRYDIPCKVKYFDVGEDTLDGNHVGYRKDEDALYASNNAHVLYKEGSWAEIIEDEWKIKECTKGYFLTNGSSEIWKMPDEKVAFSKPEAEAIAEALNNLD